MPLGTLSLIAGGLSAASAIGGGVAGYISHKKYADLLNSMNYKIPESVSDAENIYKTLAAVGLPGADVIKDQINLNTLSGVAEVKKVADNPTSLLNAVTKSMSKASEQIRDVDIADMTAKLQNSAALAHFLSSVKAPYQDARTQFDINKRLGAQRERMMGVSELFGGISSGMGAAMSGVSGAVNSNYYDNYLKMLQNYWGGSQNGQDANSLSPLPASAYGIGSGWGNVNTGLNTNLLLK